MVAAMVEWEELKVVRKAAEARVVMVVAWEGVRAVAKAAAAEAVVAAAEARGAAVGAWERARVVMRTVRVAMGAAMLAETAVMRPLVEPLAMAL